MGTNYYLHREGCEHCGHTPDPLHIGKSSGGWAFSLHIIPESGINDLPDWQREWVKPGVQIRDEYGRAVNHDEMMEVITKRSRPVRHHTKAFLDSNHATFDADTGLLFSKVDGVRCVGRGAGTWDLHVGWFS